MGVEPRKVEPDLGGDVGERAVALVTEQLARPAAQSRRRLVEGVEILLGIVGIVAALAVEVAAAGHEDVEQTVLVVVHEGDAAAERFEDRQVPGIHAGAAGEVDARGARHVTKPRRPCLRRRDGLRRRSRPSEALTLYLPT